MSEEKFTITLTDKDLDKLTIDDNKVENLSNYKSEQLINMYSDGKIELKEIIAEFEERNLDLWKEYRRVKS
jgi:hypothetical protein